MKWIITILRMAIGWHFLYEGCIKLFAGEWSAASYLNNTFGLFSGFYHWLAVSPGRLAVIDFLNICGLILIGLALFIGLLAQWVSLAGALLLALYYFAYPPFGITLLTGAGSVYVINQLFIEAAILVFFFFYKEKGYGLDEAVQLLKKKKEPDVLPVEANTGVNKRRELLKDLVSLPVLGLFGWGATRSAKLYGTDTLSGATIQINQVALGELKGELPKGKLGNHEISRLVLGGNLIAGWAHARDLLYANSLFKAYNTEKKIIDTLLLAEAAGINCINGGNMKMLKKYRQMTGSKFKMIAQIGINTRGDDMYRSVDRAIEDGADIIQLIGNVCDDLVRDGKIDIVGGWLERVRSTGYVAGLGAHAIDSLIACEEQGIIPDYYMKTMHHDNYWSAHPRENRQPFEVDGVRHPDHNMWHDNCYCPFPDRTVEFVNRVKVPVMGFKVLAAGAIHPTDGFNWAFENGADFICVGMFDFQVVDDVNICIDTLKNLTGRKREWFA